MLEAQGLCSKQMCCTLRNVGKVLPLACREVLKNSNKRWRLEHNTCLSCLPDSSEISYNAPSALKCKGKLAGKLVFKYKENGAKNEKCWKHRAFVQNKCFALFNT